MRGADLLVHMLTAYGVDVIFGVPGDTNVPLYDALREAQGRLRHVMARDERSAGYMADAYARLTNRPGVVEVPSGAGATYVLPCVAEANGSSVPLIVITSDTPVASEGRGVITELDCARLFEPVAKASWLVKSAKRLPDTVRRAFRVATGGKPGVVHLAVPEDVLHEEVELAAVSLHVETHHRSFPAYRPSATATELDSLIALIGQARRPLFVFGGGAKRSQAGAALLALAERLGMPIVNTITGQSSLPDGHRLAIGVTGDNGFHPHANRAVAEADLLVYWGCRLGSVVSVGWTFPPPDHERRIVQIDIDPEIIGNNSANALSINGDVRAVAEGLAAALPDALAVDPQWLERLNGWRAQFWREVQDELLDDSLPLKPQRVVQALNERLDGAFSILSDPGTPTPHMTRLLRLDDPDTDFIIPRAYGGLGYALPAAVGAWLARPEARPLALFGDGSFGMNCGELETLVRLGVPAVLIHFNNGCFGWIKALQRLHGHNATYSVDFLSLDAARIAEAFGLRAWRVTDAAELTAALDEALAFDGPVFIDVVVESIADVAPPVFSWLRRLGEDPLAQPHARNVELARSSFRSAP